MPNRPIYPHDSTKEVEINLTGQKFNIGDKVSIKWDKKSYEGKSNRRKVIDAIMHEWRNNSITNLKTEIERNFVYKFDSTQKTLNTYSKIIKGKKACESSVFKRHEESKDWFKTIVECIDNVKGVVVIGVKANLNFESSICPFHISYNTENRKPFYVYTVLVHGLSDMKGNKNHVCFSTEFFSEDMNLIE